MKRQHDRTSHGPFLASQLKDDDRYELSDGHPVYTNPAGGRHSGHNLDGASTLGSDPEVEWAGVDAGFSPSPRDLRAPDIAVGGATGNEDGWIPGAPPLAVEYAGVGQDEEALGVKIADLLEAGTRFVWVVRLVGQERVEVYQRGEGKQELGYHVAGIEDTLYAPGVLRNPVPVRALFDRDAGFQHTLRNLLQRQGYEDLEAVLAEGRKEGRIEGRNTGRVEGLKIGLLAVLTARRIPMDDHNAERVANCLDPEQLMQWLQRAEVASSLDEVFADRH